jgi:hypothetical protein
LDGEDGEDDDVRRQPPFRLPSGDRQSSDEPYRLFREPSSAADSARAEHWGSLGRWALSSLLLRGPFRAEPSAPFHASDDPVRGEGGSRGKRWRRWSPGAAVLSALSIVALLSLAVQSVLELRSPRAPPSARVAFAGNSMMYYNDFPRFLSTLSGGRIEHQESCLHGDATLSSLLVSGNGMYKMWDTGNARVYSNATTIHDFGACTVAQMLAGYDPDLEARVQELQGNNNNENNNNQQQQEPEISYSDDFLSFNDGKNPCLVDGSYYGWYQRELVQRYGAADGDGDAPGDDASGGGSDDSSASALRPNPPQFDFLILNDNTRGPARVHTRQASLQILNSTYLPWILQSGAAPVLMATYGYSTPYRDMGGLGTVPVFTSLTHYGYQLYAEMLRPHLPASRQPRVAPVGIAFLVVWEENFNLWERLFHVDQIHSSPLGTYLQGCVVHHALFGRLPDPSVALRGDSSYLWHDARRFQPGTHRTDLFPTQQEATYLYHVAHRVSVLRYVPPSFLRFEHGEAAEYTPQDDLYRVDDLFRA